MSWSSPELITAASNFEIHKKLSEWEQLFYEHQPIARAVMALSYIMDMSPAINTNIA